MTLAVEHDADLCGLDPLLCEGCIHQFRRWQRAYDAAGRLLAHHARLLEELRLLQGRDRNDINVLADVVAALEERLP